MFCCDVISIDALYDYTLYVRGAYNGPYIRIKHHIYVRAYNHRITNGQYSKSMAHVRHSAADNLVLHTS